MKIQFAIWAIGDRKKDEERIPLQVPPTNGIPQITLKLMKDLELRVVMESVGSPPLPEIIDPPVRLIHGQVGLARLEIPTTCQEFHLTFLLKLESVVLAYNFMKTPIELLDEDYHSKTGDLATYLTFDLPAPANTLRQAQRHLN